MEISYPVFRLGSSKPHIESGVVLYITRTREEDSEDITDSYRIVDDVSLPGNFARRRLQLLKHNIKLKKISRAVFFLGDLIKIARAGTWFIDSNGNVFKYKKSTKAKLQFKKITKVMPIPSGGSIVSIEGINHRFKSLFPPLATEKYAGVLKYGLSNILYGFYEEKYDETWRMI